MVEQGRDEAKREQQCCKHVASVRRVAGGWWAAWSVMVGPSSGKKWTAHKSRFSPDSPANSLILTCTSSPGRNMHGELFVIHMYR